MTPVKEGFVKQFFSVDQLQRFLIYFSSKHAQIGKQDTLTEVVVNLLSAPLTVTLGQHGIFFFSSHLLVYPYAEMDERQLAYVSGVLRANVPEKNQSVALREFDAVPGIGVRVSKQMGGGYAVKLQELSETRIRAEDVLTALTRGIMTGNQKHPQTYREHAMSVQLQRIMGKVNISRALQLVVNDEMERLQVTS